MDEKLYEVRKTPFSLWLKGVCLCSSAKYREDYRIGFIAPM